MIDIKKIKSSPLKHNNESNPYYYKYFQYIYYEIIFNIYSFCSKHQSVIIYIDYNLIKHLRSVSNEAIHPTN